MDRYWIAREIHGLNKVVIPSVDDFKKYSEKEDQEKPKGSVLEEKAGICAEIAKKRHPEFSKQELVREAAKLMQYRFTDLLKMRHNPLP
jgi:hypothetical protein